MACKKPLQVKLKQPKFIDGQNLYSVPVNCGKCQYCKKQRITGWSFRLEQEARVSNNVYFVTLTYNSENIPYCKIDTEAKIRTKEGLLNKYSEQDIKENITKVPTLNKSDVQKFIKRLRIIEEKKYGQTHKVIDDSVIPIRDVFMRRLHNETYNTELPLKYYAVGEYGEQNRRPHYHIIIFNIYDTESIQEAWGKGDIDIKVSHENSISYALKYLEKESTHYKYIYSLSLQSEFSLSSKLLGSSYVNYSTKKYHMSRYENNVVTLKNGVKGKVPRYIHEKLYNKSKTKDKIERHNKSEIGQNIIDDYIGGLYKHIQKENDKKQAAKEKAYGKHLDKHNLDEAKKSLSIKKLKKRD